MPCPIAIVYCPSTAIVVGIYSLSHSRALAHTHIHTNAYRKCTEPWWLHWNLHWVSRDTLLGQGCGCHFNGTISPAGQTKLWVVESSDRHRLYVLLHSVHFKRDQYSITHTSPSPFRARKPQGSSRFVSGPIHISARTHSGNAVMRSSSTEPAP